MAHRIGDFRCGDCDFTHPEWDALKSHVRMAHPLPEQGDGVDAPLTQAGGFLRLPVYDILADHSACVRWAEMAKCLRQSTRHMGSKTARDHKRINALMTPHRDVMDAALECVAGRGHH